MDGQCFNGLMLPLLAIYQISFCFCADRTRSHTLERAAGLGCQLASPDETLRVITQACFGPLVSVGLG